MTHQRYRIRFRKEGDLRFLSHRDLVRTFERAFRRAGLGLRMSQGFHPKPQMSFPLALAVGIAGMREVLELNLTEPLAVVDLWAAIECHLPKGLAIDAVEAVPAGTRKAAVCYAVYRMALHSEDNQQELQSQINHVMRQPSLPLRRVDRDSCVDIRPYLDQLAIVDDQLQIGVHVTPRGSARPREVLQALGLDDLESAGRNLTRVDVVLDGGVRPPADVPVGPTPCDDAESLRTTNR